MDIKSKYDKVKKKVLIECPNCLRVFTPENWNERTRECFNDPNDDRDIVEIIDTFKSPPEHWSWYTCPGCSYEIDSNLIRNHNYDEKIEIIEP